MIIDRIALYEKYHKLDSEVYKALEYLHTTDFQNIITGRHDIEEDSIFALINDYKTKPVIDGLFEAHRKYIDVQYVASGSELIGYAPLSNQVVTKSYDEEQDYALFEGSASYIRLDQGMFAIFSPDDLHMPGVDEVSRDVRKVVVKVKV